MKFIVIQLLVFFSLSTYSQTGKLSGSISKLDSSLEFTDLIVYLVREDSTIDGTVPDTSGHFKFSNMKSGVYSINLQQSKSRSVDIDNVRVFDDSVIYVTATFPPPCKFTYSNNKRPKCVGGHTSNIIPIIYGLPSGKMIEKAKKRKIYLGGCIISDCDPHFYCVVHKILL